MKIAIVLANAPVYSETFFNNKIKGLQDNGFDVTLFVFNKSKYASQYKQKVISIYSGNKFEIIFKIILSVFLNITYLQKSNKLFRLNIQDGKTFKEALKNCIQNGLFLNKKLDWLHFGFGTIALGRENISEAIGTKMAVSFRGFDIGIFPLSNHGCYDLLFEKTKKIHVISDDIADLVYKNGLKQQNKIEKITPAIDTTFFKPRSVNNEKSNIKFVTIARLHWKKGLEYTLEALSLVKKKGFHFHYTVIGSGPEMERLKFAAHQLNLTENITFAGKLHPDEVKYELQKASIYLQYSNQEGFCNAVLEAQAMELICIVSDAEGLSENVINNVTGFVVEKRNPVSLANKIIEVLNLNESEKVKISNAAINRVKNEFTIEKQIDKFVEFYKF